MKLFINEIIVDDRIRKNPTHIKELIDDIQENGQIQPITVRIDDEKGAHHYSVPGRSCEPLGHQAN